MMRLKIDVYEYAQDESFTVYCGGYNYEASKQWISTFAQIIGDKSDRDYNVYFGHDGSKCCIYVGETTSSWSYPQIVLSEAYFGFGRTEIDKWDTGWVIGFATSLGTISSTQSNNLPASDFKKIKNPPSAFSIGAEPKFLKNNAFNKSFGTGAGTVAEGNHSHSTYIPYATGGSYPYINNGNWIRVSGDAYGILPYTNGKSYLGTSSWRFSQIHGNTIYENGTALNSKYLGKTAKAVDSDKLDGLDSSVFLRSNTDDTLTGMISVGSTSHRHAGMYGIYDSAKTAHIWSMGTAYQISSNGSNFGNLYGFGYKHTNNTTGGTMASGHMAVWCQNGTPNVALGTNIWTSGNVIANGEVYWGQSDRRLKSEITPIKEPMKIVKSLKSGYFKYNNLAKKIGVQFKEDQEYLGFYAQEVQQFFPDLIKPAPVNENYLTMSYDKLTVLHNSALVEVDTRVERLENRIKELEDICFRNGRSDA